MTINDCYTRHRSCAFQVRKNTSSPIANFSMRLLEPACGSRGIHCTQSGRRLRRSAPPNVGQRTLPNLSDFRLQNLIPNQFREKKCSEAAPRGDGPKRLESIPWMMPTSCPPAKPAN